ncbi:hypothetical protein LPJ64_002366 [Coemansia asiatica]|uniref:LysM domain-containing protein n=1 Tax=Coemansia asiatica TaxID=1052880 RepID=A0A9W7XMX1_9FUNG|nr:hypothetical protein LPJ64_002366 [Coemansia asiatica]
MSTVSASEQENKVRYGYDYGNGYYGGYGNGYGDGYNNGYGYGNGYGNDYTKPKPSGDCVMYEVKRGDYCYKIASENNIPYDQFLAQNPGIDCTRLHVGQSVCLFPYTLPGWAFGGNKDAEVSCKLYVVKEGDLCSQIAIDHDMSMQKLILINKGLPSWNGCKNLYAGQHICVE